MWKSDFFIRLRELTTSFLKNLQFFACTWCRSEQCTIFSRQMESPPPFSVSAIVLFLFCYEKKWLLYPPLPTRNINKKSNLNAFQTFLTTVYYFFLVKWKVLHLLPFPLLSFFCSALVMSAGIKWSENVNGKDCWSDMILILQHDTKVNFPNNAIVTCQFLHSFP